MIAIVNGHVLTMAGRNYAPGTVLFENGKIAAVGGPDLVHSGVEVIDAGGRFVMPGLVEAHSHVGIAEEIYRVEGDDLNEDTEPLTPHLRAIDAVNPMDEGFHDALEGGVTTVYTGPGSANVIGGEGVVMKTHGSVMDRMILRHPAGMKVAFGENPKRVHGGQKKTPSTRMATAALLREQLVQAQNYVCRWRAAEQDPEKRPDRSLRMEALARVLDRQVPLRAHAHRADDIITAIRIAEEFGVRLVVEHCTEGHLIADELVRRQIPCIVGPSLSSRSKVELKERTFRTPAVLSAAGVLVALMTDHPVVPIQYLSLCAALAVKEGMGEEQALRSVTIDAARIIGVDTRVGSLEPGKDADVQILSGPPLEVSTRVEAVLVNGQMAYRHE